MNQPNQFQIGSYIIYFNKVIGRGQQGEVFECTNSQTQLSLCAKRTYLTPESQNENQVLQSLRALGEEKAFENLVKIFEKCDFDFEELMKNKINSGQWFSPEEQVDLMYQIANGYQYLEKIKVIHRDLKPGNILVKATNQRIILKIADFGTSKCVKDGLAQTEIGTPIYQAPELFEGIQYDSRCDIYSIVFGRRPINIKTKKELLQFINGLQKTPFKCPDPPFGTYNELISIIEECMSYSPYKRPTWEQVYNRLFQLLKALQSRKSGDELLVQNGNIFENKNYQIYLNQILGQGAQSSIYKGKDLTENSDIAVKIIPIGCKDQHLNEELEISKKMKGMTFQCQFVVGVLDILQDKNKEYNFILLEKCEQTFQQYMMEKKGLSLDEVFDFANQIVKGYLHLIELEIIHRDIKPENILVKFNPIDKRPIYKISDFGAAKRSPGSATTQIGSPLFRAPEIYEGIKFYDNRCDVYSLGIILYRLVFNEYPCGLTEGSASMALFEFMGKLKNGQFQIPPFWPQEVGTLLQSMLSYDPSKRVSWKILSQNPLISQFQRIIPKLPIKIQSLNNPQIQLIQPKMKIIIPTIGKASINGVVDCSPLKKQIVQQQQPSIIVINNKQENPSVIKIEQPEIRPLRLTLNTLNDYFKAFLELTSLTLNKFENQNEGISISPTYIPYIGYSLCQFYSVLAQAFLQRTPFQFKKTERQIQGVCNVEIRQDIEKKKNKYWTEFRGTDQELQNEIISSNLKASKDLGACYLNCQKSIDRGILGGYNEENIKQFENNVFLFYIVRFRFLEQAFPIETYYQHKPSDMIAKIVIDANDRINFVKHWMNHIYEYQF